MSRICRRLYSSVSNASASEAAQEILQRFGNGPISVREQLIDSNQLRQLSLTLGRPNVHKNFNVTEDGFPVDGTPIPAGYHLAYFQPSFLEESLGKDGTDKTVNPLPPYTRRMWAGGSLEWSQDPKCLLRVGQTVKEVTRITSAEPKQLKSGGSMILAGVEKTFETADRVALTDKRNWVFQTEITEPKPPPPKPEEKDIPEGPNSRDFCQTDITLFRFSALTFNAHKIHYSPEWCRNVEGHRDCVVHGPLNLINILDLNRDTNGQDNPEYVPKSVSYRAMSPLYMNERYRILLNEEGGGKWVAEIHDSFGKVGMKATIVE